MCQRRRFQNLFLIIVFFGFIVACDSVVDTAVFQPTEIAIVPTATLLPSSKTLSPNDNKDSEEDIVLLDYTLSPDGKTLATYTNKRVEFYDIEMMESTIFMEFDDSGHLPYGGALAFSPDGKQLALSGKYFDDPVKLWDIEMHQQILSISELPENYYVSEVDFSPNGQSLLVRNLHHKANHCEAGGEDKVTLHNLNENERIFEADKCVRYPPLQFQFTRNELLFLYYGNMSGTYSIQVINSNTGEEISYDKNAWEKYGGYLGVSPNGEIYLTRNLDLANDTHETHLIEISSGHVLDVFEGSIVHFQNSDTFIVNNYNISQHTETSRWGYWEDNYIKCIYDGIKGSPEIKTSLNGERFALIWESELQIWDVSTCEKIFTLVVRP